ncbi:hypothetical protein IE53DRAFT_391203 [Violaceomyces palustris]|uniref:Uncharacterized protein n=1 Tax=Violaceomyces palustris TaxID=1673888 RepID=A0ACD0NLH5_9BASI|nr:hypothetical protein IE53DRAFT_391203 [Violaceomyces palustris]
MAAEEHILELARPDALGPFDGIAGFSQGGALAASISARYCGQDVVDSPFRFAIFLCTGLPIGFEETLEVEEERQPWIRSYPNVSQARKRMNTNRPKLWSNLSSSSFQSSSSSSSEESSDDSASSSPISSPILRPSWVSSVREDSGYFGQLPGPPYKEEAKGNWGRGSDAFRRNQVNLQSKHQRSHGLIRIPTVHVIGARDSIASRSSELYEACDGRSRTIYRHDSGHSLPRTSVVTAGIQRAIREVIDIVRTS